LYCISDLSTLVDPRHMEVELVDNLYYLLALNRMPHVGPRTVRKLLSQWPNLETLFQLSEDELRAHGLPERLIFALKKIDHRGIESDYLWCGRSSNRFILTLSDPSYPVALREIFDPPFVLYAEGDLSSLFFPCLAMVGTREPSIAGVNVAKEFATQLARHPLTIVSGLAKGIDAAAHQGCLDGQGKTIAVLGTGIDRVYPAAHGSLYAKIKETGLILTEFPLGAPPIAGHFPRRNRIISGISMAVLVVESAIPSGSLLTARLALEQNREVMAVPGSIKNPKAAGCHYLLQQGAKLVTELEDILDVFSLEETKRRHLENPPLFGAKLQHLLDCMGDSVITVDQLAIRSGRLVADVVCDLITLELEGAVSSLPSGYMRCV
jgi:DNA processing protein